MDTLPRLSFTRSIPAWAGEPLQCTDEVYKFGVYPRVGGGTRGGGPWRYPITGLSPRGRGNPFEESQNPDSLRSIPAWAGEPPPEWEAKTGGRVYPRVGGGTCPGTGLSPVINGLSPRGRGNRQCAVRFQPLQRSIPAWAGEPSWPRPPCCPCRVYPRVGGGTTFCSCVPSSKGGLSPRGRGNPIVPKPQGDTLGSIPAWAGEPRD